MDIKGFIPNSLVEWEGKIASVIFLPGCNLRCPYCHASHLVVHPERLESLSRRQVMDYLRSQHGWLDGAVISGGEPTLYGEELDDLIREVRALGLKVMIETNGTQPDRLAALIRDGLLDAVAMDVKAPLEPAAYARAAGAEVDVESVRRSIRLILASGLPHELRITVVPGIIGRAELERMGPELSGADAIAIQNVKPDLCMSAALRSVTPYTPDQLAEMRRVLEPFAQRVVVRNA